MSADATPTPNLDPMEAALRAVVWRRREAFYSEAVERVIVTREQADDLLALHRERDDEQDRREAEGVAEKHEEMPGAFVSAHWPVVKADSL